jgi:hypothetical protein
MQIGALGFAPQEVTPPEACFPQGGNMKRIFILLSVVLCLVFATVGQGKDNPFVGTWKLDTAKSKFPAGKAPKATTRTVEADGTGAKYHSEGEAADGSKLDYTFSTQYDGQDAKVDGTGTPFGADTVAIKRLTAHKVTAVLKKDGKVIGHSTATVSADGKTTTVTFKPTDGTAGNTSVYDKQ